MTRSIHLIACAAALTLVALPPALGETFYDSGRRAWDAGDYRNALDDLLAFRQEPYGRRPDVDYMLGTSGCRVEGRVQWGHDVLDWMLYAYALTYESRQHVVRERNRCQEVVVRAGLGGNELSQIVEERAAGMTGYGKTFYWASRDQQPVASYPIRRKRDMDKAELTARRVPVGNEQAALSLAHTLVPDGRALVHDRFLLISEAGHDERDLQAIGDTLNRYVRFLDTTYGITPPPDYITVYLVKTPDQVSRLADRLHGLDVSRATVGYTFVDDLSVVGAVPKQAAGTILHELFHLLVRARFGDVPQWLDEGMAALYEVSGRRGDHYFGLPNWRGQVLDELWNDRPSIETLVRTEWFLFDDPAQAKSMSPDGRPLEFFFDAREGRRQAAMMATARYFAMYLEQRGELAPVFRAFRDRDFEKSPGDARNYAVRLVETTLGRDVAALDQEFVGWYRSGAAGRPGNGMLPVVFGGTLYVANDNVNVRTGPGTDYEKLTVLRRGSKAAVFAEQNGWYELRLADGTTAFVLGKYLDRDTGQ